MTSSMRELLVGDTSFISVLVRVSERPDLARVWPRKLARRVSSATFAISTVTFAEVRYGHRISGWGDRRVSANERWLRTFVQFPVDDGVAETWARLKATARRRGRRLPADARARGAGHLPAADGQLAHGVIRRR